VGESCGEGEQPQGDAGADAGERAPAVGFECELSFAGPEDRFDPLADRSERPVAGWFVFSVGTQKARADVGHVRLLLLLACSGN
jgi:hypothetical protein